MATGNFGYFSGNAGKAAPRPTAVGSGPQRVTASAQPVSVGARPMSVGAQPMSVGAQPVGSGGAGGLDATSLMNAIGNAAQAPPPVQAAPLTNTVKTDPNMSEFMDSVRGRIGTMTAREGQGDPNLQTQVDRLGQRMSADSRQRAQDFAAQDIQARGRANQKALHESLARRGIRMDSGMALGLEQGIRNQTQRDVARSAAGIGLADESRLDNLTLGGQGIMAAPGQYGLQREGMTNSLIPAQLQGASAIGNQNLGQQNLNLQQWQAANNFNLAAAGNAQAAKDAQLAQILAFAKLGQSGGPYL